MQLSPFVQLTIPICQECKQSLVTEPAEQCKCHQWDACPTRQGGEEVPILVLHRVVGKCHSADSLPSTRRLPCPARQLDVCAKRFFFFVSCMHQDRRVFVVGALLALSRAVGLRDLQTFAREGRTECEHEPVCVDAPSLAHSEIERERRKNGKPMNRTMQRKKHEKSEKKNENETK